jgi:uncharacterized DUF497 family protein
MPEFAIATTGFTRSGKLPGALHYGATGGLQPGSPRRRRIAARRSFRGGPIRAPCRCIAYTIVSDGARLGSAQPKEIKAHRVKAAEAEQALSREPILIYEQHVDGEVRYVYYGATERERLLAIVVTERDDKIRVITAYDLDAGQKRDYRERREREE